MTDPTVKEFLAKAGGKGGSSKSDKKKAASRANFMLARERKLQYRLDPSLKPPKVKETPNGNPRP